MKREKDIKEEKRSKDSKVVKKTMLLITMPNFILGLFLTTLVLQ